MRSLQKALFFIVPAVSWLFLAMPAHTQQAPVWQKICGNANKAETCRISQQLFISQKGKDGKQKAGGRILGLTVLYAGEKRAPHLSISLPLGVDLRPGAVLKVDKGKDIPVQYLRCTQAGCDASLKLDDTYLKALKAGNNLLVGFRPWGSGKTTVLKASLTGFSKVFKGLK